MERTARILGRIGITLATLAVAAAAALPIVGADLVARLGLEPTVPRFHPPGYIAPPPAIPVS